jgi:hypothetical protein
MTLNYVIKRHNFFTKKTIFVSKTILRLNLVVWSKNQNILAFDLNLEIFEINKCFFLVFWS